VEEIRDCFRPAVSQSSIDFVHNHMKLNVLSKLFYSSWSNILGKERAPLMLAYDH